MRGIRDYGWLAILFIHDLIASYAMQHPNQQRINTASAERLELS